MQTDCSLSYPVSITDLQNLGSFTQKFAPQAEQSIFISRMQIFITTFFILKAPEEFNSNAGQNVTGKL